MLPAFLHSPAFGVSLTCTPVQAATKFVSHKEHNNYKVHNANLCIRCFFGKLCVKAV